MELLCTMMVATQTAILMNLTIDEISGDINLGTKLPKNDTLPEEWLSIIPGGNRKVTQNSVICSKHFMPEDYIPNLSRPVLKENALPSRFLVVGMSSETAQVSSLPLPPLQYINFYTDENVRRNRAPLPPRPIHDTYQMFGHTFNADDTIIRSLESQGFRRLYPMHFERRRELKKLNHSLLVNFLDLLDLLVHCPDSPKRAEKVEDLSLLFIHIHHLLNEFRPHQARETLRVMMELQKRQRVETAMRFQKHLDKVQDILQNALQSLPDQNDIESNFKVPTEILDHIMDCNPSDTTNQDPCYELDRIMCSIVDNMR